MSYTPTPDIECPYCGAGQEICHDDGYGYQEDEIYEQDCRECEMSFAYTTSISFYYEASKAPCLNGEPHNYKESKCDHSYLERKDGKNILLTHRCNDCDHTKKEWVHK